MNEILTDHKTLNVTTRRLGKRVDNPRPLLVSFNTLEGISRVMRNLKRLKDSPPTLNNFTLRHSMSKSKPEEEKILQD